MPEQDSHPIPHGFIRCLDELKLDDLSDLQPRRGLEPNASPAQIRANSRIIRRSAIDPDDADGKIREHPVLMPAIRCNWKLNFREAGFDRIGHN